MQEFFSGYSAQELIVMLVTAVIAVTQGLFPGISILEWLKRKLGLEDRLMHYTVIGFFMVLSALAMFVTGELDPAGIEWTLESLIGYFGVFYGLSQIAYQQLKSRNK